MNDTVPTFPDDGSVTALVPSWRDTKRSLDALDHEYGLGAGFAYGVCAEQLEQCLTFKQTAREQEAAAIRVRSRHRVTEALEGRRPEYSAVTDRATDLLTDLFLVGERHGVTPEDWAFLINLPAACVDAMIARKRRAERAK